MVTGTIGTWIEANQQEISRVVVPAGATGVLLNVTAVLPTGAGFISVRPGDATGAPSTSNLNVAPGDIVPNQVTVAIPTSGANKGEIDITYGSAPNNTVDIVVDVVGYTTNTGLIDLVNRVEQLETVSPARVIWVADDNTGDYALLSEALDSINDATSSNPYVIKIAPGDYTENSNVAMKNYVDVEGSGQNTTTINCACSAINSAESSAVISATNVTAEIRHLTINNTGVALDPDDPDANDTSTGVWTGNFGVADGSFSMLHVTATATTGGTWGYGVFNSSSSPSMTNVTATATGGTGSYGVFNESSSPTMNNVTATGTDGRSSVGVENFLSSSPSMNNVTATATTGGNFSYGVSNSESSSPSMNNVTATATGGLRSYGVANFDSSSPSMNNVTATATGGTVNSYGVHNDQSSSPSMDNVTATATGGTDFSTGVANFDSSSPSMNNVTATATGDSDSYGVYNDFVVAVDSELVDHRQHQEHLQRQYVVGEGG